VAEYLVHQVVANCSACKLFPNFLKFWTLLLIYLPKIFGSMNMFLCVSLSYKFLDCFQDNGFMFFGKCCVANALGHTVKVDMKMFSPSVSFSAIKSHFG